MSSSPSRSEDLGDQHSDPYFDAEEGDDNEDDDPDYDHNEEDEEDEDGVAHGLFDDEPELDFDGTCLLSCTYENPAFR